MPCLSYEDTPTYKSIEDRKQREVAKKNRKELDKVTRLLCGVLSGNISLESNEELSAWYEKHEAQDRLQREKAAAKKEKARKVKEAKNAALSKLTEEEKKLLGLKSK